MTEFSNKPDTVTRSTRRRLLRTIGVGAGVVTFGETASASESDRVFIHPNDGQSRAVEALRQHGGKPFFVYENFDFVAGSIPGRSRRGLAGDPRVSFLEDDAVANATDRRAVVDSGTSENVDADTSQSTSWGYTRIGANEVDVGGAGVDVGVLDTGIETSHEDLEVQDGRNFTDDGDDYDYEDRSGHGTHVAGIVAALDDDVGVAGVAPEVNLHGVKVLGDDGYGYFSWIAAGIDWCLSNDVEIINMSLGSENGSSTMDEAIATAYTEGHLLISSAGNSGNDEDGTCNEENVTYPARHGDVVAVSAMDGDGSLAGYSSVGPEVELMAPGSRIYSTDVGNSYSSKSGTSMAGPFVTGVAGLAWAVHDGTGPGANDEIRSTLVETAETVLGTCEEGNGLVDALAAVSDGGGEDPVIDVETKPATDVGETTATLAGELIQLENVDEVNLRFDYGVSGEGLGETATAGSLSTVGSFEAGIDALTRDTTYEYRAVVVADGETVTGSVLELSTESGESGGTDPTIETFDVDKRQSGPWIRATVGWDVADEDGSLATVTSELLDGSDVVDSVTSEVSGSTATDEHELRTRGDADAVRLTVGDDAGNTTTATTGDGGDTLGVETVGTPDVGENSATLAGELTNTGDATDIDVGFEYGNSGGTLDGSADAGSLSTADPFETELDGLDRGTEYDFRAVATSDAKTDRGDTVTFTTPSGQDPTIDTFEVSTRNTGQWLRADVEWTVSDPDGGLSTVETELFDGESTVDTETSQVDGSSASGEHGLRTRGEADSLRLTVTNREGNDVSSVRDL